MNITKILLIMLLALISITGVFGVVEYDVNSSVPINAQYTYAGILTHANANLTITFPNGTIDLNANSVGLTEVANGVFTGTYNTTFVEGKYKALVVFYNDSWSELGRDTQYFNVGFDKFGLGDKYSKENRFSLIFLLIIGLIMYLIQLMFNVSLLGFIGGLVWVFLSLSFFAYSSLFGLIILVCGLAMTIHATLIKT